MATKLYDANWVGETIARLSNQIMADRMTGKKLAVVGLQTRGAVLAERLGAFLSEREDVAVGSLDITMYRDDLHTGAGLKPIKASDMNFDLNDANVILVDDVMCTGRTIRAAMNALFAYGRPACVRLLVMLDRGGKELPIRPDFTGAHVEVPKGGFVRVKLSEIDELGDAVYLVGPGDEEPA
jgi:pyrimidine operon attenuation protein/uracil phosphoribosyltransferase